MGAFQPQQELAEDEFRRVAHMAMERYGIRLTMRKREMVRNRLIKLARHDGFTGLSELVSHLESSSRPEDFLALFDALSTNLTHFYREANHFTALSRELLEPMKAERKRQLRIWSAGCSSGCEPYTIGMVFHETVREAASWDAKILATDFSTTELSKARRGVYEQTAVDELDSGIVQRYFEKHSHEGRAYVKIKKQVRDLVTFGLVNLMDPWKMKGPFDAIFCRNVMIYFDAPTRLSLVSRFKALIRPGGLLFIGSAENLPGHHQDLERVEASGFRKL